MYVALIIISCVLQVNGQTETKSVQPQQELVQSTTKRNVTQEVSHCQSVGQFIKLEGVCTTRAHCDYGTPAIDYTLYRRIGTVLPCQEGKVCCPNKYILPDTPPKGGTNQINDDNSDESNLSDY